MIDERILLGYPINFSSNILIYPPKVKDAVGEPDFWSLYKILTFSQEEIEDEFVKENKTEQFPTPLEFLLSNSYNNEQYAILARKAFQVFCRMEALFVYEQKKILLGVDLKEELKKAKDVQDLIFLDEENFFDFQNGIRLSMGEKTIEKPKKNEDPRIKRMKAKARYRDKIKAKKGFGLKLSTSLVSICCMNTGLNPLNIGEISYASIHAIMQTYQEKEKFEIDIGSLQSIGGSKVKPIYWIRNLDD